jgi:predicted nucleotidyltransferase
MRTLEQVTAISDQDKVVVQKATDIIHKLAPFADVLLYGSVAKGIQGPESDYDLLVLTEQPLSKQKRKTIESAILDFELEKEVVVSTIYYSKDQWDAPLVRVSPFHKEVERDAVIL